MAECNDGDDFFFLRQGVPVQILQCRSNKWDLCWLVVSFSILVLSDFFSGVFGGSAETSVTLEGGSSWQEGKKKKLSTLHLTVKYTVIFDVLLTSAGSVAFTGSWLSISISPLCVILVIGRLSASLCSFSIISIVCEMRNVLLFRGLLKVLRSKKKDTLILVEPNFHIRILVRYWVNYCGLSGWIYTMKVVRNYITDLSMTYMSVLPFAPSSQFFWGQFLRAHSN